MGVQGGFNYKGQGVSRLPFKVVAAYDNDEKCVETYNKNIPRHAKVMDLSKGRFDPADMPKAEILIGGFPCQDFATGGPRKGLKTSRGRLYEAMLSYVKHHKPKVVIGENVPGLANVEGGKALKTIKAKFADAGYNVFVWDLFAPDYGVPQRRTRLFIVAVRDNIKGEPVEPRATHTKEEWRTAKWAIDDLVKVSGESLPNHSQYFNANKAKKGNGQGDETTMADAPSYTIRANAKSRVQFHYSLKRRLTIRECARFQTFPDSFVFPHSTTTNIMQIGNAVPPLLGHAVAHSIAKFLRRRK